MITIEHDVHSGVPNEKWTLTLTEATDFIASLVADLTVVRPFLAIPGVMGDVGYIVSLTGAHATLLGVLGVPTTFRITDQPLDLSYLDLPLLGEPIAPGDTEEAVDSGEEEDPDDGEALARAAAAAAAACSLAYTSWNDFSFWNGSRQANNNCYCYGANYATNNWSWPGKRGGSPIDLSKPRYADRPTVAQFTAALKADGWKTTCNGSSLRIVAYLGKTTQPGYQDGWDYHFYRKNLNGSTVRWCHKPGQKAVTNKDSSGNYITNPSTANRVTTIGTAKLNYNQVVGTFYSPATRSVTIS